MTDKTITTPKEVSARDLAAAIINTIGQDQSDGWWYAMTPKVEELLKKYKVKHEA